MRQDILEKINIPTKEEMFANPEYVDYEDSSGGYIGSDVEYRANGFIIFREEERFGNDTHGWNAQYEHSYLEGGITYYELEYVASKCLTKEEAYSKVVDFAKSINSELDKVQEASELKYYIGHGTSFVKGFHNLEDMMEFFSEMEPIDKHFCTLYDFENDLIADGYTAMHGGPEWRMIQDVLPDKQPMPDMEKAETGRKETMSDMLDRMVGKDRD